MRAGAGHWTIDAMGVGPAWNGMLNEHRLNTLPSYPVIRGCSARRKRQLLKAFDRRQRHRRVAKFWFETGQDFDMYVGNIARKTR